MKEPLTLKRADSNPVTEAEVKKIEERKKEVHRGCKLP